MTGAPAWSWPGSLWAAVTPARPDDPPLLADREADLVVIGAGLTGLTAALHGAEAGHATVVLEAAQPGYGASGRTNGQVIPTLSRPDPDDLAARWGETGERFAGLLAGAADRLFAEGRRLGIAFEAEQSGWVQPVHSPGRMRLAERRVAQWARRGADVALLSAEEMAAVTGSRFWHGGWTARRGGHINPLALTRGLADAVAAAGGVVHGDSPVQSIHHDGTAYVVRTARACVRAQGLVLATNAYVGEFTKGLEDRMRREVVPVASWQMATQAVGDNIRAALLPGRQALSDTHATCISPATTRATA